MISTILQNKVLKKTIIIFVWLIIWQCISIVLNNPLYFAGPIETVVYIWKVLPDYSFWYSIAGTLGRVLAGFIVAFLLAVVMAWWSYESHIFKDVISSLIYVMKSVPVASVVVILLIWFGSSLLTFFVSFMIVFPVTYENVLTGLNETDKKLLEMAKVYRIDRRNIRSFIYINAVTPYIRSSVNTLVGMAFKSGIAAEIIGLTKASIGERIYMNKIYLETAGVFGWTLIALLLSVFSQKIVVLIIDKLLAYKRVYVRKTMTKENTKTPVELNNVCIAYSEKDVIQDLNLKIMPGECIALMGESGSGKTTILKAISLLLPVSSGQIVNDNTVAFCFQEDRLIENESVLNNIRIAADRIDINEVKETIEEIFGDDISELEVRTLSGGMKRRVALLRALLSDGNVLLLDEPFAGLDELNRNKAIDFINKYRKGRSIIIASHNKEDAVRLNASIQYVNMN